MLVYSRAFSLSEVDENASHGVANRRPEPNRADRPLVPSASGDHVDQALASYVRPMTFLPTSYSGWYSKNKLSDWPG